ncbi:restriction endonuclease subunit S, partial [Psittacicella gerlachiana]
MTKESETNLIPMLRFPRFKELWVKDSIENIFSIITRGKVLSTKDINKTKTKTHKYPVYSSQTINDGVIGYHDEYLFENTITWTTDGYAGNVYFREVKFYCTNVCGVLISHNGFANKAMAEIINRVAYKYVSPAGIPKLMNNVMST